MTRPGIVRADTIDLQDRDAPSAKDHSHVKSSTDTKDPLSSSISTSTPSDDTNNLQLASHQAETLRGVAAETAQDRRISWTGSNLSDLHIHGSDLAADIADTLNLSRNLQESALDTGSLSNHLNMSGHQQQDALAIAQNGGDVVEDDMEDVDDEELEDDMMDKISSSPSIEDEDIDFEFVYALHTFMATVEGQANATKGDTMVLLDDSNSYWWLVRVVKDSSIGYLPAEHIETPTERLARLNKHRNIDLSASMLGDQAEKTKNPLKSAMRRRKAKTVAFAPPTYVDYSDIDYSTDEEDLEAEYFAQQQQSQQQQDTQEEHKEEAQADAQQQDQQAGAMGSKDGADEEDETAKVEPLKPRAPKENGNAAADAKADDANDDGTGKGGLTRTSEEIFVVSKSETPGPKKTKDGTVRDSFFKDDTVETKKITLTPNLLRDDSAPRTSSESKDVKQRPSLDRLDKDINSLLVKDDKKKKDKKEKDKKAGGFRSLFSRKDKKKGENEDDESFGKRSMDIGSEGTERDLDELDDEPAQQEKAAAPSTAAAPQQAQGPQRNPSKLQKQQPLGRIAEHSPTRKAPDGSTTQKAATMRLVESDGAQESSSQEGSPKESSPFSSAHKAAATTSAAGTTAASQTSRPQRVTKAPARAVLNEFESDEEVGVPEPLRQAPVPEEEQRGAHPDQRRLEQQQQQQQQQARGVQRAGGRLSESPVQVSPVNPNNPPALMVDTSSQEEEEEDRSSPISSPSPELLGSEDRSGSNHHAQDSITTSTSATTANTATWNDASLRAFFDSGTDVRDLLVVVYDKTDVVPAGPDHPVVSTLFKEQNAKLAEITTQLDNMLGDWLARKQRLRGTV